MLAQISGARPIHSLTGPAMAVMARLSAPMQHAAMNSAVIQGEMPCRLPALTNGASVIATTAAEKIGSKMARPK